MPWSARDADRHIKGLSDEQKHAWAVIANSARKSCLAKGKSEKTCDAQAVRIANAMVRRNKQTDEAERVMRLNAEPRQLHEILGELREGTIRHDEQTGVLTAEVVISKEAVLPYETPEGVVYEYIPAEELRSETFLKSAHGKPVTDGHPAEEIVTMDTLSEHAKGALHGPFEAVTIDGKVAVVGKETIWDADLINEIMAGRKRQVSVGRWAVVRDEEGEFDGKKYTRRQTSLVVNHLAHTDHGRQGDDCRILLDEASVGDIGRELDKLYDLPAEQVVGALKDIVTRYGRSPGSLAAIGDYIESLKGILTRAIQVSTDAENVAALHAALEGLDAEWPELSADTAHPTKGPVLAQAGQQKRGDAMPTLSIKIGTTELQLPEKMLSALDEAELAKFEENWKALTDAVTAVTTELATLKAALAAKASELDEAQAHLKEANDKHQALADAFKALNEKVEAQLSANTVTDAVTREVEERLALLDAIRLVDPDYNHAGVETGRMKRDLLALFHEDMREDATRQNEKGEYVHSDAYIQARVDLVLDALRNKKGASLGAALLKPMVRKNDIGNAIEAKKKARLEMYRKGGER